MLTVEQAMREALDLAVSADAPRGLNPRVGCVIIADDGQVVGRGYHRGAGTAHAEADALAHAGAAARGSTAVVTLEPCRHTGRTGPCTEALIRAGVRRVVYALDDPTEHAAGGADVLRAAGIEVVSGVLSDEATEVNRDWLHVQRTGRPLVVLKTAMTLDGRVADASGGPTPITGAAARRFVHAVRSHCDAVLVGTSTAIIDDPQLTVRDAQDRPVEHQPLRAVMGERDLPAGLRVLDGAAPTVHLRTRHVAVALAELRDRGVQRVLLEGGPTLAGAFLDADAVDEIVWLVAPRLLGAGPVALAPLRSKGRHVVVQDVRRIGDDVVLTGALTHD